MKTKTFDELTAADVMRRGVVVQKDMTLRGAARRMTEGRVGAAAVTDASGRCAGLLLAADLVRWVAGDGRGNRDDACAWSEWQLTVAEDDGDEVGRHMIPRPLALAPDEPLSEVARRVLAEPSRRAVVVDERHRPLGVISAEDILPAAMAVRREVEAPRGAVSVRSARRATPHG